MSQWRPVLNYEGHYEVSDDGQVRGMDRIVGHYRGGTRKWRGRVLRQGFNDGYLHVGLCLNGLMCTRKVHHLVLEAFVGVCPVDMIGRHMDGNPSNNNVANLRWGTQLENAGDREIHGRTSRGEKQPGAKLVDSDIPVIIKMRESGASQRAIAARMGVSSQTIWRVIHGITWRHIKVAA